MKKIIFVLPILVLLASMYSCDNKTNTTNTDSTKVSDTTLINLKSLRDSSNKAWEMMTKSDDQKISDVQRLLQEISYCKKYDAMLLDSLTAAVKTMKDKRYNQLTMTSEQIDQYDAFTDKVLTRLRYLATTAKGLKEHPLAETLYSDIAAADADLVRYRNLCDKFTFMYNDYLETNKNALGDKAKEFTKLPVFTIQVPS